MQREIDADPRDAADRFTVDYLCTQACLPELKKSAAAGRNPQVLNLSPPLAMKRHWFAPHAAYTMAK